MWAPTIRDRPKEIVRVSFTTTGGSYRPGALIEYRSSVRSKLILRAPRPFVKSPTRHRCGAHVEQATRVRSGIAHKQFHSARVLALHGIVHRAPAILRRMAGEQDPRPGPLAGHLPSRR
jgi:hypothetical protein